MAQSKYVAFRMGPADYQWYVKLSEARRESLSDTIRSALTAYRALMQLPGVAFVRPLSELRGELVAAYQERAPIADILNDGNPATRKSRGRSGSQKGK